MATNPSTLAENVGRIIPPDANYTYGSAKDDTTGVAGDGTPIKKALMNDSYGFFQAALVAAGIVPSGNAETVLESQILQALQGVVGSFSDRSQWPTVALGADTDHDIVFSAGKITDSSGLLPIVTAGLTKQIDNAWVAGTNVGGLFSGSVAVSTTYHLFLIVKDSDLSVDAGFDTDSAAANIPVGYTAYRRIASLYTDGSSNLVQFYQQGDDFWLETPTTNFNGATSSTPTLAAVSAPQGLETLSVRVKAQKFNGTNTRVYSVRAAEGVNIATGTFEPQGTVHLEIDISTTSEVKYESLGAAGSFFIGTTGWIDDRTE